MCIPSFNIPALKVPEKNSNIKLLMRARSLILDPTIHQLIVHVYTKFQDSSYNSSWDNCDTKKILRNYGVTRLRNYAQTNSSIAPPFQSGVINTRLKPFHSSLLLNFGGAFTYKQARRAFTDNSIREKELRPPFLNFISTLSLHIICNNMRSNK